jgi:hypothetical protein
MILIVQTTFQTHCVSVSIQIRANIIIFFINTMCNIKPLIMFRRVSFSLDHHQWIINVKKLLAFSSLNLLTFSFVIMYVGQVLNILLLSISSSTFYFEVSFLIQSYEVSFLVKNSAWLFNYLCKSISVITELLFHIKSFRTVSHVCLRLWSHCRLS